MNRRHAPLLRSLSLLMDCLEKHEAEYRNVPGFAEQVAVFRRLATKAQLQEERALDTAAEVPPALREVRESLIRTVRAVSGPLAGWAAILGDENLRGQVVSTESELRAMGPALTQHARAIAGIGRRTLDQGAAHYGLATSTLQKLDGDTAKFEEVLANHPDALPSLRSAADQLYFFLRDVMDPLVRGFLLNAPEFCAAYRQARRPKHGTATVRDSPRTVAGDAVLNA